MEDQKSQFKEITEQKKAIEESKFQANLLNFVN
jgi:hypothetical protein